MPDKLVSHHCYRLSVVSHHCYRLSVIRNGCLSAITTYQRRLLISDDRYYR